METIVSIPGMHCQSCATMIKEVSAEFPQVTKTDVDLEKKQVLLEHEKNFDPEKWTKEIESLGEDYKVYPVS